MSDSRAPTERFTSRVDDYAKYRPGYPPAAIELLVAEASLGKDSMVADVGAGTGILTQLLLDAGAGTVVAIDPNAAMAAAAQAQLGGHPGFRISIGSAERIPLEDRCCDLVVAAQAFHWFDRASFRAECVRVLRPGGRVALLWNDWSVARKGSFLHSYEQLVAEVSVDYNTVKHGNVTDTDIANFYAPGTPTRHQFTHSQQFTWDGVLGRVRSSSYAPSADSPAHDESYTRLRGYFDQHAVNEDATIDWIYDTTVWLGELR